MIFCLIMLRRVVAAGLLVSAAASPGWAQSETREPTSFLSSHDDRIMEALREKKGGAVALDVEVGPGRRCSIIRIALARRVDGQWKSSLFPGSMWLFAKRLSFGTVQALVPGDYLVGGVSCQVGQSTTSLNGPYAKFSVKVGEVINLGVLKLDYQTEGLFGMTGKMKKSITGMTPEVRTKMREEYPRTFAKAVERRMTLVGPEEVQIKKKGLW
jgi:hypothetical protein